MMTKDYTLTAPDGIHARPATALIRLVRTFQSDVRMKKDGREVQLNSILQILGLVPKAGDTVTVTVSGPDEGTAFEALDAFFTKEFAHV
jgi:phosphotransferase system HPr (HPr) family protein